MKDIGDHCVDCHEPTHFGSGRFVNRIPADNGIETGYLCAECQREVWSEGCILDGVRGWYVICDLWEMALDSGLGADEIGIDHQTVQMARDGDTVALELLQDTDSVALEYLTEQHAPNEYSFGWYEGSIMLWSDDDWHSASN